MTDTLVPVERTNWMLLAWNSTLDRNDHDVPSAWLYGQDLCEKLRTSCLHLGSFSLLPPNPPTLTYPSPPPTHPPPCNAGLKLMHTIKNCLKRHKIKRGTISKVNCILFNRLLSPVLLNKSGLVRAKAGYFNLSRCFSNYYQV